MIDPDRAAEEILAQARLATTFKVYPGHVPDGEMIKFIPGTTTLQPYGIVTFMSPIDTPVGQGIIGARNDSAEMTVTFQGVGSSADDAMQVVKKIRSLLLGFTPTNCGELRFAFFAGVGQISSLADPTRYAATQAFRFYINP